MGCVGVVIKFNPPPSVSASFAGSLACVPGSLNFIDNSITGNVNDPITMWLWSFGDGATSNQQNPSHTYSSSGIFDVTLTITLPGGCTNTITKSQLIKISGTTVTIANAPAGGCIPFSYSPVAQIQSVDSIISYSWDLGEPGAIYTTQFPTHIYNTAGNYNIKLTVIT